MGSASDGGSASNPWHNLNNDIGVLSKQYFNDSRSTTGSGLLDVVPATLHTLGLRFDASGDDKDTWTVKDLTAFIEPVVLRHPNVIKAAGNQRTVFIAPAPGNGSYRKGNTIYFSVPFDEPVYIYGTPKLSTSWGDFWYLMGSGTNVLTFSGEIKDMDASTGEGLCIFYLKMGVSIKDLAGQPVTDLTSDGVIGYYQDYDFSIADNYAYQIDYSLDGGRFVNPKNTYDYYSATFTLTDPIREASVFNRWETGTSLTSPTKTVTIATHSHGDRRYTASWTGFWGSDIDADGTAAHPYRISEPDDLVLLSAHVDNGLSYKDKVFELQNDIDMSGVSFTPIGKDTGTNQKPFSGTFKGNGFAIQNLTANRNYYAGLFGRVVQGTVENVILDGANITAKQIVGGIVASIHGGSGSSYIRNCFVLNSTITSTENKNSGIICGSKGSYSYLIDNYNYNCTLNGEAYSDSNTVVPVTLGSKVVITAPNAPKATYHNAYYYLKNADLTLDHENGAEGGELIFSVNGAPLSGNTFRLTGPADITVTRRFPVTFSAGEGTGAMNPATVTDGSIYGLPDCTFTAPEGKQFVDWQVQIGNAVLIKNPGDTITVTGVTTITARYACAAGYYLYDATSNGLMLNPANQFAQRSTDPEEYTIIANLTEASRLKVVKTTDGIAVDTMYPSASDPFYGEANQITEDGVYCIRFRPNADGEEDWYYGCISVTRYYTVTLLSGAGGTGDPIVITTVYPGVWSTDPNYPNAGQFYTYSDYRTYFKLPECPVSFAAVNESEAFIGWKREDGDEVLEAGWSEEVVDHITLIAQWAHYYTITYAMPEYEDIYYRDNSPVSAPAGKTVDFGISMLQKTFDAGYRLLRLDVSGGPETIRITKPAGCETLLCKSDDTTFECVFKMPAADVTITPVWTAADGYYLIGPDWDFASLFPLQRFQEESPNDFILRTTLTEGQKIKVVKMCDGYMDNNEIWYPDGFDNEYVVDAAHAGPVCVQFNPDGNSEWAEFGGYICIKRPFVASHSLTLDGSIGVNFYVQLIDDLNYDGSKMKFAITHGSCTEEQALVFERDATPEQPATPTNKAGNYQFTCYVSSIQMAETITATFCYEGAEVVLGTYSVKEYIDYFDEHPNAVNSENKPIFPESTANLIKALKNYGVCVQQFLQKENHWSFREANDDPSVGYLQLLGLYNDVMLTGTELNADPNVKAFSKENWQNQFSRITYSLALDSGTTIKVFFALKDGVNEMPAVTVDGDPYTPVEETGRYVVKIENIPAHLLGKEFTIVAGDATVKVSALSYVKSMLAETGKENWTHRASKEQWTNAALALYAYCVKADAYLH